MAARTLSLTEAFAGPQITLYGNVVADFAFNEKQANAAGLTSPGGAPRFARILAVRRDGLGCLHLPRPLIMTVFGDGEELTETECGYSAGQVRKWTLGVSTRVLALDPSQGTLEEILASSTGHGDSGHGRCECEGGAAVAEPWGAEAGACVSVTINNGQACLNIPIFGSVCIPVPSWIPSGTVAEACIDICTKWGVPCGVRVSIKVAGNTVASKSFGCC